MRKQIILVAAIVILFCLVSGSFATTATFQGLGGLPSDGTPYDLSVPFGVSSDGSVVAGVAKVVFSMQAHEEAFHWTGSGGMVSLGDLPGGKVKSDARGISANGSVIVGFSESSSGIEAFRWENNVMTGLDDLSGGNFGSVAYDASSDGSVIVGYGSSASGTEAFRWENNTMTGLGDLTGGDFRSVAYGVSPDGSMIVGFSESYSGHQAFRWENNVMTGIGYLPGGSWSEAYRVSADGSVIVGWSDSDSGREAFRWRNGNMEGLGDLSGGDFYSWARDVSADGSIVVGMGKTGTGGSGYEAFIWDEDNGMQSLQFVFEDEYGLDLTGWTLQEARGISDDSLTIVGYGINPDGYTEAWIATIPEPATLLLLGFGGLILSRKR